jgi:hypothetical protein
VRCRCGASNTTVGVVWRRELRCLMRGNRLYVPTWRSQGIRGTGLAEHPPPPKRAPYRRVHTVEVVQIMLQLDGQIPWL